MRAVVPAMQERKSGSIINVSSIWGNAAVPGVRVNSLHPGFIDTPLVQAQVPEVNAFIVAATPMKRGHGA